MKKIITGAAILISLNSYGQTWSELVKTIKDTSSIQTAVGIGTTAKTSPLTVTNFNGSFQPPQAGTMIHIVSDNVVNGRVSSDTYNNVNFTGPIFQGRRARGTAASPTATLADDILVAIAGDGYGTSFTGSSVGGISVRAEANFTATSKPTYTAFTSTSTGSTSSAERFRIKSTGLINLSAYNSAGILQTNVSGDVATALLTSGQVTTALGYTPGTGNGNGTLTAIGVTTGNGVTASSTGGATPNLSFTLGAITPTSTNGVSSATMAFMDATSSVQTQINGKQASGNYASGVINTGDNAANTTYANDYRAANFIAGTNYLAPNGNGSALTNLPTPATISGSITENQVTNLVSDLALKANIASPTFTGTVGGITQSMVGLGNVTNESKATMFTNPIFTGTIQTFNQNTTANAATVTTNANLTGPVTSTGNATTIAAGVVTLANMANMATGSLIYRRTAASGVPEVNTLAQLKTDLALVAGDVGLGNVTNESKATMFTSPALTGAPLAPTAAPGTNTTQIATTAFVNTAIGQSASTNFSSESVGTGYTLTATAARCVFGTTSPQITFSVAGTYRINYNVFTDYIGATLAASRAITYKVRRTNNTATDLNTLPAVNTPIITLLTFSAPMVTNTFNYTAAAGDIIEIWGSISVVPTAGTVRVTMSSFNANKLY